MVSVLKLSFTKDNPDKGTETRAEDIARNKAFRVYKR